MTVYSVAPYAGRPDGPERRGRDVLFGMDERLRRIVMAQHLRETISIEDEDLVARAAHRYSGAMHAVKTELEGERRVEQVAAIARAALPKCRRMNRERTSNRTRVSGCANGVCGTRGATLRASSTLALREATFLP